MACFTDFSNVFSVISPFIKNAEGFNDFKSDITAKGFPILLIKSILELTFKDLINFPKSSPEYNFTSGTEGILISKKIKSKHSSLEYASSILLLASEREWMILIE